MSDNQAQQFSASDALGKAQDYAKDNGDQVSGMIDKAQEAISNVTGGTFDGAIAKGAEMLEDKLGIPDEPQAEAGTQTGSAPQEGTQPAPTDADGQQPADTTAPEAPIPGEPPVQDPSDPAAPADPSVPSEPSVQPSGEPGTTIPAEPGTEPATEPGYGGTEGAAPEYGAPEATPTTGLPSDGGEPQQY